MVLLMLCRVDECGACVYVSFCASQLRSGPVVVQGESGVREGD